MKDIVFVIPARAGSKGVIDKNIKPLNGRTLIQRSIDCIRAYDQDANIILNSDSYMYLNSVKGNITRFHRSKELGSDNTKMVDVLNDMENTCQLYRSCDIVVIIQPTCPFREPTDIRDGLSKFKENLFDTVISVTKMDDFHPARMYRPMSNTFLKPFSPKIQSENRQMLDDVYHRNGLIYITKKRILSERKIIGQKIGYIEISRERALNIDDIFDWKVAVALTKDCG